MDIYSGMVLYIEVLNIFFLVEHVPPWQKRKKKLLLMNDTRQCIQESAKLTSKEYQGVMESEGAVRIWQGSEGKGYRYATFLSDGDSSS